MLSLLRHRFTPRILATFVFELVALNAAFGGFVVLRSFRWSASSLLLEDPWAVVRFAAACTLLVQAVFWYLGLYSRYVVYRGRRVYRRLGCAFVVLAVGLYPVCAAFAASSGPVLSVTAKSYVALLAGFFVLIALERFTVLKLFGETSHFGNILILGNGSCTERLIREARTRLGDSLRVVGILAESRDETGRLVQGFPVLGDIAETPRWVRELKVRTLVLATPYGFRDLPLDFLVQARLYGTRILDACRFYESLTQAVLLERLEPYHFLSADGYAALPFRWKVKTALETGIATVLLLIFGIPMLAIAAAIRLTSPGPAIYRQKRVGRDGKIFELLKFRTMVDRAEDRTGPVWARKDDDRVTPLGKWLRRFRVDELPQLINILRGEMAFVGPRPERPEFVEELEKKIPYYRHRHFVKPGLTGWAQVAHGYAASVEAAREKLRYDLYYVKHMSIPFDLVIILATVRAVLQGRGLR
ncbi:MAG: sugar transferase [Planctomycetota bacterium]